MAFIALLVLLVVTIIIVGLTSMRGKNKDRVLEHEERVNRSTPGNERSWETINKTR